MPGEQIYKPIGQPVSGRVTPASFPFYTTGEDNLRLLSFNSATGVTLKINARLIDAKGISKAQSWDHTPNTDRSQKTTDIALSGLTLLNVTIFAASGTPKIGQTFVILQLIRGLGAGAIVLGTVLQGPVTATQALGFPGSPLQSVLETGGYYRTIVGTAPGVDVSIVETCPAGARWELRTISWVNIVSANPGLRLIQIQFKDASANLIGGARGVGNYQVSNTIRVIFSAGYSPPAGQVPATDTPMYGALPFPIVLLAGGTIVVPTVSLGDTFSAPTYEVLEWLEP